jgi:tRNA dimethylallyltransferase
MAVEGAHRLPLARGRAYQGRGLRRRLSAVPSPAVTVPLIVIIGPTASGKSRLAVDLALAMGGEVVSADAFAVYRGMDIGTAKPTPDERRGIPHHLIDVIGSEERSDGARWLGWAETAIAGIHGRGQPVIVAGGTPLYVRFLLEGLSAGAPRDEAVRRELDARYDALGPAAFHAEVAAVDPGYAGERHPNDRRRLVRALEVHRLTGRPYSAFHTTNGGSDPRWRPLVLGLAWPREVLYERINRRTSRMLEDGLVDEVRGLAGRLSPEAAQAVGYKELIDHLAGRSTLAEAETAIATASRHLAKHQMTFYRRFPGVRWLDGADPGLSATAAALARDHVARDGE